MEGCAGNGGVILNYIQKRLAARSMGVQPPYKNILNSQWSFEVTGVTGNQFVQS